MPTEKQKVFDKKKPYGSIIGHDPALPQGSKYEQNGMLFDHNGKYLSGEYKPAGVGDVVRDQNEEIEQLRRELAEAKKGGTEPQPAPKNELDRGAIIKSLTEKQVKFPKTGTTEHLYKLLQDHIDQAA